MQLSSPLLKKFNELNSVSRLGSTVLFGSTFASTLPINELSQDYGLNHIVYNRSIEGLSIADAKNYIKTCVTDLAPNKLFIALGDEDLDKDVSEIISQYEWLLYQIHSTLKNCRIYLVSVCSKKSGTATLNKAIKNLAADSGCKYINISDAVSDELPELKAFNILKTYLRDCPINFADAMMLQGV